MTQFTAYSRARFFILITLFIVTLSACSSSDDDDSEGYIRIYNASENSPELYLAVEEDLSEELDDEIVYLFSGLDYSEASSRVSFPTDDYDIEIAWQDEDSNAREDLQVLVTDNVRVNTDSVTFLVVKGDIQNPQLNTYSIDVIDDEDDDTDDLFNLQILNVSDSNTSVDVYLSKDDETFAQAVFVEQVTADELTENQKVAQDDYKIYLTLPGETDVIFESEEVDFESPTQFVIIVRDSLLTETNPITVDVMTNGRVTNYASTDSTAKVRFYNGIALNDLNENYNGSIDLSSNIELVETSDGAQSTTVTFSDLSRYESSSTFEVERGDYSISLADSTTDEDLLMDLRLSLSENDNKTVFFYSEEEAVDDDGDGNVDENDDGIVDEIRVINKAITVSNSQRERLYEKLVTFINLVDSDDFTRVSVYFVKANEVIDTADNSMTAGFANPTDILLINNTYQVFVVATIDGVETILIDQTLTLSEDSTDQFFILERVESSISDYQLILSSQLDN